jgi:hypothetical protein
MAAFYYGHPVQTKAKVCLTDVNVPLYHLKAYLTDLNIILD